MGVSPLRCPHYRAITDAKSFQIGVRPTYRSTANPPVLAGMMSQPVALPPYGRNQQVGVVSGAGGRMPYAGDEVVMTDLAPSTSFADPNQHRQPSGHHHHHIHHHHHHHPLHRPQASRQHPQYSNAVPIMDQTIYGQAQARREGRQVPTTLDPFESGRRRERANEEALAALNGTGAANRGDKHRRHVPDIPEFQPVDGPVVKKRKTAETYHSSTNGQQPRSLMDVKVDGADGNIDPRLGSTSASGSLVHHRSVSPQNQKRDATTNPLTSGSASSMMPPPSMTQSSVSGFSSAPVTGRTGDTGNHLMGSASLSAGPQQPPQAGHLSSPSASAPSGHQQQPASSSWGYRFPTGATPGLPSTENRNRYLAGMAAARN